MMARRGSPCRLPWRFPICFRSPIVPRPHYALAAYYAGGP